MFGSWDVGEAVKVADLVKEVFGYRGVVEVSQDDPGLLLGGYFLDNDTRRPGDQRRRTFPFQGRSLAEFEEQIRKARQL